MIRKGMRTPIQWPPQVAPPGDDWPGGDAGVSRTARLDRYRRAELFATQEGLCIWDGGHGCLYPGVKMILENDRERPRLHPLFATFEHVVRRRDGGCFENGDVALAHEGCNRKRERTKKRFRMPERFEARSR